MTSQRAYGRRVQCFTPEVIGDISSSKIFIFLCKEYKTICGKYSAMVRKGPTKKLQKKRLTNVKGAKKNRTGLDLFQRLYLIHRRLSIIAESIKRFNRKPKYVQITKEYLNSKNR